MLRLAIEVELKLSLERQNRRLMRKTRKYPTGEW